MQSFLLRDTSRTDWMPFSLTMPDAVPNVSNFVEPAGVASHSERRLATCQQPILTCFR